MKINSIESELKRIIKREVGIGYSVEINFVSPGIGQISGGNELRENVIKLYISPEFKLDERSTKFLEEEEKEPNLISIAKDVGRHEGGHWEYPKYSRRGCPYDWFLAERIIDGTNKGLPEQHRNFRDYVANAFMDIVDNLNVAAYLRERGENFAGQVWFYYDQGNAVKEYSPFYDFFVRIQEDLWMNENEKEFLKPYHTSDPSLSLKIEESKKRFFDELGLKNGIKNLEYNLSILMNKNMWELQAETFAKIASELLPYGVKEFLTGGESVRKESRFGKKIKDPEFLKKVIEKRWKSDKGEPSYLTKMEALSYLYRELAKDIPIRAYDFTESYEFPVVGYGRKISNEISRKIGIDEHGELTFLEPKHWWSIQIPVKRGVGGVPNIYFLLDSSGSMAWPSSGKKIGKWYSNSKYHYALLGFYGIINFLTRNNILPNRIAITLFSTNSKSIIVSPTEIEKAEEVLFEPQFMDTLIDLDQVKNILKKLGSRKNVMIMISDGQIYNWNEVRDEIKDIMKRNYSAFISIKEKSEPYFDLMKVAKVFYVENEKDLPRVILDFVEENYGRSI
jgi:hypothetical protein